MKLWQWIGIVSILFMMVMSGIRIYQKSLVPTQDEWQMAIAEIKKDLQTTDGITWFPEWAGEGRIFLRDLQAQAFYLPYRGKVDLGHHQRVWLIRTFGKSWADFENHFEFEVKPTLEKTIDLGDIEVDLLKVNEPKVVADLYQSLDQVQVKTWNSSDQIKLKQGQSLQTMLSSARSCSFWDGQAWHCDLKKSVDQTIQCLKMPVGQKLSRRSRDPSSYYLDGRRNLPFVDCGLNPLEHVARDVRVIESDPRFCVWLPPHQNRDVVLIWQPQVSSLSKDGQVKDGQVRLQYGWEELVIDHPFREKIPQSPIELSVSMGHLLFEGKLVPNGQWQDQVIFKIKSGELSSQPTFEILVKAQKQNKDAKFCMNLSLRF
jgi:hypothetical protein